MSGDDWKRDVRPLRDRRGRRAEPEPPAAPAPREAEPEFVLEAEGSGRRADVARKVLAGLRRGEWPAERECDLHGLETRSARRQVEEVLAAARAEGLRCVRLIHGRGLHSEAGPVLRERVAEWLAGGAPARSVLAWARDPRDRGGSTLVLLRRLDPEAAGRPR